MQEFAERAMSALKARQPFNSLFEMRSPLRNRNSTKDVRYTFNSLFEMPHKGAEGARQEGGGFQFSI